MPIGKDSIKTRVAKVTAAEVAAEETAKAETPAEVKAPAKKPATKKAPAKAPAAKAPAKKPATAKAPAKKPAAKAAAPKAEEPATAVLSNVSPETVAAVIGHEETKPSDKVKIGQKLPTHLL